MYLLIPVGDEPDIVRKAVSPPADILELGCGVGRVTHALVERGYRVVAVDESADMLAHVAGAETVRSRIERLRLGRVFDAVTLMSHLVNTADVAQRDAFLRTCRRHLSPGGVVVIQRADPSPNAWVPGERRSTHLGSVTITARVDRRRGTIVDAVAEYSAGAVTWLQPYRSEILTDEAFGAALARADLRLERWLDRRRIWAVAVAVASGRSR
jgi:SAM-dependent methyltransferase